MMVKILHGSDPEQLERTINDLIDQLREESLYKVETIQMTECMAFPPDSNVPMIHYTALIGLTKIEVMLSTLGG